MSWIWITISLLCLGTQVHATENFPPDFKDSFDYEGTIRIIEPIGRFQILGERFHHKTEESRRVKHFLIGTRYKISSHLKFAILYKRLYGFLHDEDWQFIDNRWQWDIVKERGESQWIAELSPRFLLADQLRGMIRIRYILSNFRNKNMLSIRPGLNYLMFKDGVPHMNFFFQVENLYQLSNRNGNSKRMETWSYLGSMYHLSKQIKVGGYIGLKSQIWFAPDHFLERGNENYTSTHHGFFAGLFINLSHIFDSKLGP